jgi:putative hydrolase of the HAD superfamily
MSGGIGKIEKKFDVDGVIFDLGSTLLEYETIPWSRLDVECVAAGLDFLRRHRYEAPPPDAFMNKLRVLWRQYRDESARTLREWRIIDGLQKLLSGFNLNGGKELAAQFFDAFYQPVSRQLSLFADAPTVLKELKRRNKNLGLVSNTIFPEEYHQRELKEFGLKDFLDFTIFSVTFGYRKPHPAIYERALQLSGLEPDRLLFVGDRYLEDYAGPRERGLHAVLRYRKGRDYPDYLPDDVVVIKSLTELLDYIMDK